MNKIRRIHWVDMIVDNPATTSLFYERVFGFERSPIAEDADHTSYVIQDGGQEVLGLCDAAMFPNWVPGWLPYIDVEDYDQSVAQIESAGGRIHRQMTMNYSWEGQRMCLAIDPSGAPVMICESQPDSPVIETPLSHPTSDHGLPPPPCHP
jgi:predicted enzyme related to lactoylglutathione lyase